MPRLSRPAAQPWSWCLVILAASSLARAEETAPTVVSEPAPLPAAIATEAIPNGVPSAKAEQKRSGEVVRERYDNRQLKLERHVAQDADGSYFNHGLWQMWDPDGRLVASGEFDGGMREGKWQRFYLAGEAEIVSGPLGSQFEAPFTSEAEFAKGKLDGKWTIVDAKQRPVVSWNYARGKRDGTSVWWFPNGNKWREVEYRKGRINGTFCEWNPQGLRLARESYLEGRRVGMKLEWYEPGVKKVQAEFLFAREESETDEDWWTGYSRENLVKTVGEDERHGRWVTYYRNGQIAMEGRYDHDQASGTFTWWHPNGQKAIEGQYDDGRQAGLWSWWHTNGQKHIQGNYEEGTQVGYWKWWSDEGKVVEAVSLDDLPLGDRPLDNQSPANQSLGNSKLEAVTTPPDLKSTPEQTAPPAPKLKNLPTSTKTRAARTSATKTSDVAPKPVTRTTIRPAARHG